jgi:hypothetical protein
LIMALLLHLHESLITIMPMMTHQPRAITSIRIDLHLGQNPKLGGRYADNSVICTSDFVYPCFSFFLFLCCSCFISAFQNTKIQRIFLLFLFVCFFSFLVLVCFTFYFRFGIQKI